MVSAWAAIKGSLEDAAHIPTGSFGVQPGLP